MSPDAHDYDILIAGAGPAGCAAAYDLARAGKRVLLLDRRSFPRHKACACGLTRKTLAALRYSVDPIVERVCHEIVLQGDTSEEVRVRTRSPICAMAVRERFDAFCLQQTLAMGAALLKTEAITALRELPTHIELDLQTAEGPRTLTATALIGADGSNGQTRRLATTGTTQDPSWYSHGFALEACVPYAALPAQLPSGAAPTDLVFDFAPLPGGYGWLFPKGDHINIGVGAFAPSSAATPTDLKAVTRALLLDYAQHKLGTRELPHITGQALGMGGHAYVPHGRVLLVGDAAGLVDPLTGEGIHSAVVSGQAAAAAILAPKPTLAAAYATHLRPLQETLAFSHRAARSFYATPERGLRAMRTPILRSLILKTYADGLPHTRAIATLARLFT
jgi:geranylgeranyl reductase family protein